MALRGTYTYEEKKSIIAKSGLIAGIGLFLIYAGLIALGAITSGSLDVDNRTQLLSMLSSETLGSVGTAFLAVLVSLACFTTAVGIVTGVADFVKGIASNSQIAYKTTAVLGCALGVVIGQFDVHFIINIAIPALMFIYPITIVLILLNVLPERYGSQLVFRAVTIATLLFSIPDFLQFFASEEIVATIKDLIPFSQFSLGWVMPAFVTFVFFNLIEINKKNSDTKII